MRKVIFTLAMASAMLLASNANAQIKVKLNPKSAATKVAVGAAAGAATSALKSNKGGNSNASEASAPASKPAETKSAVAPAPAASAMLTFEGEDFTIQYPSNLKKEEPMFGGKNTLEAVSEDGKIKLNAEFSGWYELSQINEKVDYFKKKAGDYYGGEAGTTKVDGKIAIYKTADHTMDAADVVWMFVVFNKDYADVTGEFRYPEAKAAEGEAIFNQILNSIKFK
jgi:carbon monoxide dehydrogenase subunit G